MKKLFEELANEWENTTFSYEDFRVAGAGFSKQPITMYSLEMIYKGNYIRIKNDLGNHNTGNVELRIKEKLLPDFEVSGTNHFANLFLRRKELLKVTCGDIKFKKYLEKKLIDSNLEQVAKDNLFEPKITCKAEMLCSDITTLYHLEFSDKIGAIKAIVHFYKDLIDY